MNAFAGNKVNNRIGDSLLPLTPMCEGAVSVLLAAACTATACAGAGTGTSATTTTTAGATAVGSVVFISCPDVVGIGSAVNVDMVTVAGEEASAPSVRNIAINNIHFRNDQQHGYQATNKNDHYLFFFQIIISARIIEGAIGDCVAAGKIICAVLDGHFAVLTVIQASSF